MVGKMNKIQAIVFSCNRAMQLQLLLTSIKRNISGIDKILVTYNYTNDGFLEGYQKLMKEELADEWVSQQNYINTKGYRDYIIGLLENKYPYVCLFCDDTVVFRKIVMDEVLQFMNDDDVITFLPRIGLNTVYSFCGGKTIVKNPWKKYEDLGRFIRWNWKEYSHCNGYPLAMGDGHVYRTPEIKSLLGKIQGKSVNGLENHLQPIKKDITRNKIVAYKHSALVSIPVNRVQTFSPQNVSGEKFSYPVEELNEAYLKGYVADFDKIDFSDIKGTHQELALPLKPS